MILRAMGATKPGSQGERAIRRKTIAQGMPDDLADPVVTAASFSYCWRAMGEAFTRHSLRPLLFLRVKLTQNSGAIAPRECGHLSRQQQHTPLSCPASRLRRLRRGHECKRAPEPW